MQLERFFARFFAKSQRLDQYIRGQASITSDQVLGASGIIQRKHPIGFPLLFWAYTQETAHLGRIGRPLQLLASRALAEHPVKTRYPTRLAAGLTRLAMAELCHTPLPAQHQQLAELWQTYHGLTERQAQLRAQRSSICPRCTGTGKPRERTGQRKYDRECTHCQGHGYFPPAPEQRHAFLRALAPDVDQATWTKDGERALSWLVDAIHDQLNAAMGELQQQINDELAGVAA